VALQGTLSDFALPDVLHLLASTQKSGELHVRGDRGEGRMWLDSGKVVATEADRATDAVDTVFELLRYGEGTFLFNIDVAAPRHDDSRDIAALLSEAQERLAEWQVIETVVPSLATPVGLAAELKGPAEIDPDAWRVLVAAASGGTVHAVARSLGCGEFGACRAVKQLVDRGLVEVLTAGSTDNGHASATSDLDSLVELPARRRRTATTARAGANGDADPSRALDAEVETMRARALARDISSTLEHAPRRDEVDPMAGVTPEERAALDEAGLVDENGEPINRSLLLKFLSSVRS
jgi:hypothetical protein